MIEANYGKYYALNTTDADALQDVDYIHGGKNTSKEYSIATVEASNLAENVNYSCPYKVKVSASQELKALISDEENPIKTGDLVLTITGDGIEGSTTIDLSTLSSDNESTTGTFTITGGSVASETNVVKASLYLDNKQSDDQTKALSGKNFDVTVSVIGTGACTMTNAGD